MTAIRRYCLILFFAFFQFHAFAQQPRVVLVNSSSKELKRTARRLRITVEQLKNAREALEEATDLAETIDPLPISQISNLMRFWQNLDKSKAQGVMDGFVQDLREKAANAKDANVYQLATSSAMSIVQSQMSQSGSGTDYDKMMDLINSWPEPSAALGPQASSFRKSLENSLKLQNVSTLSRSDPEKAYELLTQSQDKSFNQAYLSIQVAQGLMNKGKKEEALKIIDQNINNFSQQPNDPRAVDTFGSFGSLLASYNIAGTDKILEKWAAQMMSQPPQNNCAAKVQKGETTLMEITCAESKILNAIRSMNSRPALAMKLLNSVPALKTKLDHIGGIDSFTSSSSAAERMNVVTYNPQAPPTPLNTSGGGISSGSPIMLQTSSGTIYLNSAGGISSGLISGAGSSNVTNLFQELKGKAEKSPSMVKTKLRSGIKGPEEINILLSLASLAASQDPDLAAAALEIAQEMLPQIESLQKRASTLQEMVRIYRQVDGEVDSELLKTGFLLADQLRQEQSDKNRLGQPTNPGLPAALSSISALIGVTNNADQLEAFLISELSRDSFEMAMRYVRSMEKGTMKLNCLTQIVQALSQQY
jgi:tetratricopeptide (TPR) repeat protein